MRALIEGAALALAMAVFGLLLFLIAQYTNL